MKKHIIILGAFFSLLLMGFLVAPNISMANGYYGDQAYGGAYYNWDISNPNSYYNSGSGYAHNGYNVYRPVTSPYSSSYYSYPNTYSGYGNNYSYGYNYNSYSYNWMNLGYNNNYPNSYRPVTLPYASTYYSYPASYSSYGNNYGGYGNNCYYGGSQYCY